MLTINLFISLFFGLAILAPVHAAGLWLILMIAHGLLVELLGETATHIPLYVGITVLLCILFRGRWSGIQPSVLLLFGALIFVMGLASVQGIDAEGSVVSMIFYAKTFLLALLLAGFIKHEQEMKAITLYCLAGMVIGALIAMYQHYTGTYSVNTYNVQRAGGLRGDPNDTAMLLIAGVPLAAYWLLHSRALAPKVMFASSLVLLVLGIALTGSRGGFLALLFISLLIFVKRPTLRAAIAGIVLVSTLLAFAPQTYWTRMQTLVSGQELKGSGSLQNRLELQRRGLTILLAHPLLGVGLDNFAESYFSAGHSGNLSIASPGRGNDREYGLVAHNMYLEFFVENGILGGLLLIMIFYKATRNLMRYDRRENHETGYFGIGDALGLALIGMLFSGLFLSQGKNSVLWFLIGLGFATGRMRGHGSRDTIPRIQPESTLA